MECKLRCVNFRKVSDRRRAVQPAFGVTEITDDCYRSTLEVVVISLGTPRSTEENFGYAWKHLGTPATSLEVPATSREVPATSLGAPATSLGAVTTSLEALATSLGGLTSLGAPMTSLRVQATSLRAPRIAVEQAGKIIFGNTAGLPGNHSYYLSFNDC
jgi:hypothetical protein